MVKQLIVTAVNASISTPVFELVLTIALTFIEFFFIFLTISILTASIGMLWQRGINLDVSLAPIIPARIAIFLILPFFDFKLSIFLKLFLSNMTSPSASAIL